MYIEVECVRGFIPYGCIMCITKTFHPKKKEEKIKFHPA